MIFDLGDCSPPQYAARNEPTTTTLPDAESLALLALVSRQGGLTKGAVCRDVCGRLGTGYGATVHHLDALMGIGAVVVFSGGCHVTPAGTARLGELKNKLASALNLCY